MNKPGEAIFYFVGPQNPETTKLKEFAQSASKHVFQTSNAEEIDQGSKQIGKGILIFSDTKFAMNFLSECSLPDVPLFKCLLIEKNGSYSPEIMKNFKLLGLHFYTPKTVSQCVEDLQKFLVLVEKEISAEDLEFSVNLEIKGE
jgi:hypothetical protein